MAKYHKALLFYNERSGQSESARQIEAIRSHFDAQEIALEIIIIPKQPEIIAAHVNAAILDGVDLFIAAGGDGTVSLVGSPLVNTGLPLGILPIGTGNLLAKELKIPLRLDRALKVITALDSEYFAVDAFKLGSQSYIMNLSVGVSSKVMEDTPSEEKKRLGFFAYLFHFIEQLLGLKLDRFSIEYDGHKETHMASEVHITNSRLMGVETLKWPEDIALNDGQLDLFIIRATNFWDILRLLFTVFTKHKQRRPIIKSIQFKHYCRIETKDPMKAQADGDTVGATPLTVEVQPQALTFIVPKVALVQSLKKKE